MSGTAGARASLLLSLVVALHLGVEGGRQLHAVHIWVMHCGAQPGAGKGTWAYGSSFARLQPRPYASLHAALLHALTMHAVAPDVAAGTGAAVAVLELFSDWDRPLAYRMT